MMWRSDARRNSASCYGLAGDEPCGPRVPASLANDEAGGARTSSTLALVSVIALSVISDSLLCRSNPETARLWGNRPAGGSAIRL